ncbi:MAG: hypothetical protein ACI8UD_003295 [Planctomycetota bacterium]|jgi:hypothetical protein
MKSHLLAIALAATLAAPLAAQKGPTPAQQQEVAFRQSRPWSNFVEQVGGDWLVDVNPATGTPKAIWGPGLPLKDWRENSLEEARRHANMLLRDRAELLSLGTSEFREVIGGRMGRTWSFVYDQYFRSLAVIGGRADVRIHEVGRVAMFGSTAMQIAPEFQAVPTLLAETATAIAWQSVTATHAGRNYNAAETAPRLVIWGDVQSRKLVQPALAWEVAINNREKDFGRVGRYYIDAHSGAVLHFVEDRHLCAKPPVDAAEDTDTTLPAGPQPGVTVITQPHSVPGTTSATALPSHSTVTINGWQQRGVGYGLPTLHPLPGIKVAVSGFPEQVTDENGQFTITVPSLAILSLNRFRGRHHLSIGGGSEPIMSYPLFAGNDVTFNYGGPLFFNDQENAHNSASYWVDHANEYCRNILGNTAQLNAADGVLLQVNYFAGCGSSSYEASTNSFDMADGGSSCTNASFSSMILHEWGHELDNRYGGIANQPGNGLSEAWGDIISMMVLDDARIGLNYNTSGFSLRNGYNQRLYTSLTPTTPVHDAGEVFMGFAWKFRELLAQVMPRATAISISNDVVIGSIVADATNQVDAVREAFIADDDDGNLANGTPHFQALISACAYHALPYPTPPTNDNCSNAIAVTNGINGPFSSEYAAPSGTSWWCATGSNDVWFSYTTSAPVTLDVTTCGHASWDTMLELYSGTCGNPVLIACNDDACSLRSRITENVLAGTYLIRVGGYQGATGSFSLEIGSVASASSTSYGTGCGTTSKAFYEFTSGNGIDLNGMAMTLVNNGSYYTVQAGGTFVPPSAGATDLGLGLDDDATVNLTGTFAYPGGTTSSLVVCSNGFVSAGPGNGLDYTPTVNEWLDSAAARWGSWHDFDVPTGGAVKFEQAGVIAYVTWDGVFSYGTSNANTWQLQFNLATHDVTYVWQSIFASGDEWLVGYASGTNDNNAGATDISLQLPGTFQTSPANGDPMILTSTMPTLSSSCVLTTTDVPAAGILAIQLLSLTAIDPGIDLTFLGMPGCHAYTNLDSLQAMAISGGQASHVLPIPSQLNLIGFELAAQSAVLAPTLNSFGFITSNGVLLTIGT